jgi:hypothetical protein
VSRIKEWFAEFNLVLDATPRMEYLIAAAGVIPALMFAFGTWLITGLDTSGPFGAIVAAVEGPFEMVNATLSAILFFRLIAKVAKQYRTARARLYGL